MSEVRPIDANALKEDLRHYFTDGVLDGVSARLAFNQILHDIDNAPTIEIPNCGGQVVPDTLQGWRYEERPQGEWIDICTLPIIRKCSLCGVEQSSEVGFYDNYCPCCGAYMKGGAE